MSNVTMEVVKTQEIIRHGRKKWRNLRYGLVYIFFAIIAGY
jgi:hypothetical protein